ncbi:TPA: isoprenylcysteine carboxylmethyltransferase family protein, partial [Mannheimia haemolytica]|nr:isoprenylcysteine carboxylmethyltransferase family protein [Mannheimia haemolytica]
MKSLKLKIPPPAWFLLCAALMWLVAQYVPVSLPNYQHTAIFFSGLAVAIIGGA